MCVHYAIGDCPNCKQRQREQAAYLKEQDRMARQRHADWDRRHNDDQRRADQRERSAAAWAERREMPFLLYPQERLAVRAAVVLLVLLAPLIILALLPAWALLPTVLGFGYLGWRYRAYLRLAPQLALRFLSGGRDRRS